MASALPHCPPVSHTPEERSTVDLREEPAGRMFEALASDTARAIVDRLEDAGVVTEADVWYSARGTEMSVYAPRVEEVVVRLPGRDLAQTDTAIPEGDRSGREG